MVKLLGPVVKRSAEDLALDAMRNHIVTGELEPGARITEHGLSTSLALSRATVRTALHRLAMEGLIVQTPFTGWHVIEMTPHDVWELYTLRSALEGLAASVLARRLNETDRAELNAAFERLEVACRAEEPVQETIAALDFALHQTIIELAGHARLLNQYRLVEQQIRMYISSSNSLVCEPKEIVEQHRDTVEYILAGDAKRAAQAASNHALSEGEKLEQSMK